MLRFKKCIDLHMVSQVRSSGSKAWTLFRAVLHVTDVLSICWGPCSILGAGSWVWCTPWITALSRTAERGLSLVVMRASALDLVYPSVCPSIPTQLPNPLQSRERISLTWFVDKPLELNLSFQNIWSNIMKSIFWSFISFISFNKHWGLLCIKPLARCSETVMSKMLMKPVVVWDTMKCIRNCRLQ